MNRRIFLIVSAVLLIGCTTPFQKAIMKGDDAKLRSMIEAGYDVNRTGTGTDFGERPLFTAASVSNLRAAQILLDSGADVNGTHGHRYRVNFTPLVPAAWWGYADMVDLLLKAGADPNLGGDYAPLLAAVCVPSNNWDNPPHKEVVRILLRHGASPNISRRIEEWKMNATPLSCAVRKGDAEVVRLLLEHGAEVDQQALSEAEVPGRSLMKRLLTPSPAEPASAHAAPLPPTPAAKPPRSPSPLSPTFRSGPRPDDFALVVGIQGYKDLPDARFAERDAQAVASHMQALGIPQRHIIHLSGSDASYISLKKYLESWLPRNAKSASRVFFYFSGHGAPDAKTGEAYLVPWDGDPNFLEDTAYPLKRLYASLEKLEAGEILVALDACFSGAGGRSVLAKGARPLVTQVELGKVPEGGLTLLTAASSDEITTTLEEEGHGIFTYFFLKGLNGEAKDRQGSITAASLYDYLKPRVQDEARLQNREQTPTLATKTGMVLRGN